MPTAPKITFLKKYEKPFNSVSFTRYDDWCKCPRFANEKHLRKSFQEPKSPAMERGGMLATAGEDYLLKRTNTLHKELRTFADEFKFYRAQKSMFAEVSWGFKRDWTPTSPTNWNECFLRIKIDVGYLDPVDSEVHLRDNKTGKFRDYDVAKYMLQLDLYSAGASVMFPDYKYVVPRLNYTDLGITYPDGVKQPDIILTMEEARAKRKEWDGRFKKMTADVRFPPRPGRHCEWCPLSKAKGGACEY